MATSQKLPQLIIAPGTHVVSRVEVRTAGGVLVCPMGAVGTVAQVPADATHSYRVRLPDGREVSLKRQELRIRKHLQQEDLSDLEATLPEYDYSKHVIYRCIVGSRAYGLAPAASDVDRRGIYLPPADLHWSLFGVPEQLEDRAAEECYWELEKFLRMALKANPNILECLYSPLVETATELALELVAHRSSFLSKRIYQTYNGYVLSQFKKLEQDLRPVGEFKRQHSMHLIRLLLAGVTALREGTIPVQVKEHREELLAIKSGEMQWEDVNAWRLLLHAELDKAFAATGLPEQPDYDWANAFLLRARRSSV